MVVAELERRTDVAFEAELRSRTIAAIEELFVSELWRSKDRAAHDRQIENVLSALKSNARLRFDVAESSASP